MPFDLLLCAPKEEIHAFLLDKGFAWKRDDECDCDFYTARANDKDIEVLMNCMTSNVVNVMLMVNNRHVPLDKDYSDLASFQEDFHKIVFSE